jgi:hypothetical protein
LTHGNSELIVSVREIVTIRREDSHIEPDERGDAGLLRHQVTSEAAGVFNNDCAHAISGDAFE